MSIGTLLRLGEWLRGLSLSGAGGNIAAWGAVLGLTALPALGLLWRGRCRYDWLLLLAAEGMLAETGASTAEEIQKLFEEYKRHADMLRRFLYKEEYV